MDEFDRAKRAVHVAGAIFRATGISKAQPEFEPFPGEWTDEIVCGAVKTNRDGSITVDCTVQVYGPNGERWESTRKIRLTPKRGERDGNEEGGDQGGSVGGRLTNQDRT